MDHTAEQIKYFSSIDRGPRWKWQVEDPFIRERELATLAPLVDVLHAAAEKGVVRVLESGCGDGINFAHLASTDLGTRVQLEGVDVTPRVVDEARSRGMKVQQADGLALPFLDQTFDVTYCRDVFHHLADDRDRKRFFQEMERVTKRGGSVVAIEPNGFNPAIFGLGLLVRAERGLWSFSERRFMRLLPGAVVSRVSPSAAWRMWYHYRSPLYRFPLTRSFVRFFLRFWERICSLLPTSLWSYRVYVWKREALSAPHLSKENGI